MQGRRDILEPAPDRIVLRRVHMAVEPVRHARLLLRRRPRRDDAQVAIDLHRIRIDDRAADLARQRQRQRRLAARGRPCDKHRLLVRRSAMTHVATLISNPAQPALDEAALRVARAALPGTASAALARSRHRGRHSLYAGWHGRQSDRRARPRRARRAADRRGRAAHRHTAQAAVRRRHGFHHDRPGMHRRARRLCGAESACGGDHRARDARRDRVRAGAARARGVAEGPAGRGGRGRDRQAHHAHAGWARAGRHDAAQRRLCLPRLRRLHAVHRPHRRADRFRRASRQYADRRWRTNSPAASPSRSSGGRRSARR